MWKYFWSCIFRVVNTHFFHVRSRLGSRNYTILRYNAFYLLSGASYNLLGCYKDTDDRDLSGFITFDRVGMTVRKCYYTCRWKSKYTTYKVKY